ncbi:MAG: hypothetical protein WBH97_02105 [Rectinemataceae bacterium]
MLAVILAEDDAFARAVAHRIRLSGHTVVRYRDPVKLIDNLPELGCDLLVARQVDYPLHWQAAAAALAHGGSKVRAEFLLAAPDSTAIGELAAGLGVKIIPDAFSAASGPEARTKAELALGLSLRRGRGKLQGSRRGDTDFSSAPEADNGHRQYGLAAKSENARDA